MRVLCGVERSMVAMFAIGTAAGVGVRVGGNAAWAEPEELHKQVSVLSVCAFARMPAMNEWVVFCHDCLQTGSR